MISGKDRRKLLTWSVIDTTSGINPVQARAVALARANAKASLQDLFADERVAKEVLQIEGRAMRGRIDEAIFELERTSPSDDMTSSELLDGKWRVRYAGCYAPGGLPSPMHAFGLLITGGFSPANALSSVVDGFWGKAFGFEMGPKTIQIKNGEEVQASAEVQLPNGMRGTMSYVSKVMPMSSRRMSEQILSFDLPKPLGETAAFTEFKRTILLTYLDEDMLVVRDESGVPEVLERIIEPVDKDEPET